MSTTPVIIERTYNAPSAKVWDALTNNKKMKEWYFDIAEFKPEVGFEFSFIGKKDDVSYIHLCKVTEVVEGKKLTYSWRYEGFPGNSFVSFELFDEGDKTRVKLTHTGLETLASGHTDFKRENFVEGWNAIIGTLLKNYVEGAKATA